MQSYEKYVNPRIKAQEIFLQEVQRRVAETEKALKTLETSGYHPDTAMVLYKFAFTLKGNGQMVGLWDIADPASDIMVALVLLGKYQASWNPGILNFLQERFQDILDHLPKSLPEVPVPVVDSPPANTGKTSKVASVESAFPEPIREPASTAEPVSTEISPAVEAQPVPAAAAAEPAMVIADIPSLSETASVVESLKPKVVEAPPKAAEPVAPKLAPAPLLDTPPAAPTLEPTHRVASSKLPEMIPIEDPAKEEASKPPKTVPAPPQSDPTPTAPIIEPTPPATETKPPETSLEAEPEPEPEETSKPPKPSSVPEENQEIQPERKILLVDDDPALDLVIQESLQAKGFKVLSARTFKDAEKQLANESPDLMVVDILRKPEDGIKISRAVRSNGDWRPIPIIFLSAREIAQESLAGYTTQADDYLVQPIKTGELVTRIQVILNRSERKQELVYQDELTKLFNRRHLQNRMQTELTFAQRTDGGYSLGMFNLDAFKRVNEMYGRLAGDETLICLIERIQANLRPTDLLCRYGEETFVILMPNTTKYEGFCFIDRIREAVSREPFPLWQRWLNIHLTLSAGISAYPIDGETVDSLLKAAEVTLHQAKRDGKNRVNM